jgi:hypothetical protein
VSVARTSRGIDMHSRGLSDTRSQSQSPTDPRD